MSSRWLLKKSAHLPESEGAPVQVLVQKDEYRVAATQALRLYFDVGTFFNDYQRFVFLDHVCALLFRDNFIFGLSVQLVIG
jgi:hypothetical protein